MGEFEFITRYFQKAQAQPRSDHSTILLGIGDDCALLTPQRGMALAVSTDMLIEGRHFLSTISPQRLGHKALAVNLSDLAAMGAKPLAFTLSISMPKITPVWCEHFAQGVFDLANTHNCTLIGGDTTSGPLSISITIFGQTPLSQALRRSGAQPGDDIYVSHPIQDGIGDARLMFEALQGRTRLTGEGFEHAMNKMERPIPRVELGMALQGLATSAIDLSDGLLGDLSHILDASGVGARIEVDLVPRGRILRHQPIEMQRLCTLSGGDDYELLFTAPANKRAQILTAAHNYELSVTLIGRIEEQPGTRLYDAKGYHVSDNFQSFDHFNS